MALPLAGTPIVLDIGSAYVKVGFAGESGPRFIFPCITGSEKYQAVMGDVGGKRSMYVGNDAMKMRGVLKVKYPIQRGTIMHWEEYYEILNHIFYNLLRIENLSNYPIIYAEHPFIPGETKEYIARLLFETHKVNSLIMMPSPLLSSFSVGLTTGLVIESGDGITWIVPIINGQIQHQAVQKLLLSGMDVNHNLKSLLMREGINIESSAAEEILKEIKEKNCYFVLDPNNPPMHGDKLIYPMPDGSVKEIPNRILYEAPEVMFQPTMLGYNIMNIPQAVIYSLQLLSNEYWGELLGHIVFSGGNLSYSGFEERLKQELNLLLPQLGTIPKIKVETSEANILTKSLEVIQSSQKSQDNCPSCGVLVDLYEGIENCPSCGVSMGVPKVSLELRGSQEMKSIKTIKGFCPYCKKDLKDESSVFCPYCGKDISKIDHATMPNHAPMAKEFVESTVSDDVIRFFVPDNLLYAIFNGAAILGSLYSFQGLLITYDQFQANPAILNTDISEVFR